MDHYKGFYCYVEEVVTGEERGCYKGEGCSMAGFYYRAVGCYVGSVCYIGGVTARTICYVGGCYCRDKCCHVTTVQLTPPALGTEEDAVLN